MPSRTSSTPRRGRWINQRSSSWSPRCNSKSHATIVEHFESADPAVDELVATRPPLFTCHGKAHVIFPYAVDLEIAHCDTFAANIEFLHHTAARGVAGNDRDLHSMQTNGLERELRRDHKGFGRVAHSRAGGVDPIADVRVLEGTALHGCQVHLSREGIIDEHAERIAGAELAVGLS